MSEVWSEWVEIFAEDKFCILKKVQKYDQKKKNASRNLELFVILLLCYRYHPVSGTDGYIISILKARI